MSGNGKYLNKIINAIIMYVRVSLGPSNIVDDGSEGFILRFSGKLLFEKGETTLYNEVAGLSDIV